ncbi:MAG: tRNA pseudouridine(38-40) synthase TruA [Gemmatimonadales bacterium]
MERAFLLFLEFDGTEFCGWQRQAQGRSVQMVVEDALSELAGSTRKSVAAGRTDAGVHAVSLPITVAMPERWTCADLLRAVNAVLPGDVAVREVRAVADGTDARRSATGRRYQYDIGVDRSSRSPWRARREWPLGRPLAVDAMETATGAVLGSHDFRAFATVGPPKPHYDCTVIEAAWQRIDDSSVRFVIAADRFLHHMVRMLVGTLVDIGLERRPGSDIDALLARRDNHDTSPPAPAGGLSFVAAQYPDTCLLAERAAW